jgi:sarcosine oxidase subunit alpha
MTRQSYRLQSGGRIDRSKPLSFTFDGKSYQGYAGDTLASALVANGVRLVGRSFKYHRPRGIYTAGIEEPNALVTLRSGARHEPNVAATKAELYDGLEAVSQNRWPSLKHDMLSVVGLFSKIFAAGFYYKTFMGPTRGAWMVYEHFIRKAAGMGDPTTVPDADTYEKAHDFCDLLVVGAGPAGLAAAITAGRRGMRVILVEDDAQLGGSLLEAGGDAQSGEWLQSALTELDALPNVRVMTRTCVFGAYDGMTFALIERVSDHLKEPAPFQPRQRYWRIRAERAILASGRIERPLVFGNNDLPGVMLAGAVRTYVNRHAALPGRKAVVFTNNDSAYTAAADLRAAGADVSLVDVRATISAGLRERMNRAGVELHLGCAVGRANGGRQVSSVDIVPFDPARPVRAAIRTRLNCDLLAVSGGWTPTLHLMGQRGAKPVYDEASAALIANTIPDGFDIAGGAAGEDGLKACVAGGVRAGEAAAKACGQDGQGAQGRPLGDGLADAPEVTPIAPVWQIPHPLNTRARKKFVDLQHDVGAEDLELAQREGYVSVEHTKRYTTLGMANDQGKTSNLNALGIMAGLRGQRIAEVGTTTFRPPFRPVSIGAIAGPETGLHFKPSRRSPMHDWHASNGAAFTTTGLWLRPWYFPKPGESKTEAYIREAAHVRRSVGMVDVSSLGKIDVQGPDAAEFLNRVYVNGFKMLPVGKARYGVMLRPDGIVMDDGTTSRISEHHYFMTTTTAGAGKVMSHLEFLLQTAWQDLRVHVTSVTSQWAGVAIAGPRSREVLEGVISDIDLSDEGTPFMGVRHGHIGDLPVRVLRISFSGERAYEVYTPAGYGMALWQRLLDQGKSCDMCVYGVEALGALRIEKGHVAGGELEGRTTLADMGLGKMASTKKPFIGGALAQREGMIDPDRPQLVGLELATGTGTLRAGAILCDPAARYTRAIAKGGSIPETVAPNPSDKGFTAANGSGHMGHGIGFVSSVTWSPELNRNIALAYVSGGMARKGEQIDAVFPMYDELTPVRVTSPHFVDPEGERLHG